MRTKTPCPPAPRPLRRSLVTLSLMAAGLCMPPAMAAANPPTGPVRGVLLRFKNAPHDLPSATASLLAERRLGARLHYARRLDANWALVEADRPLPAAQAEVLVQTLRGDARLAHVMPDAHERRAAVPNDTLFRSATTPQWWLDDYSTTTSPAVANFTKAWDTGTGSASTVIAVLDTGITAHPDLQDNILPGYNFISSPIYAGNGVGRTNDATDKGDGITAQQIAANPTLYDGCNPDASATAGIASSWHGTLVAGQLAAVTNNGAGVAGINWQGKVLPVRVSGQCGALVSDMVDGMKWAAGMHVDGVADNLHPAKVLVIGFAGLASCSTSDTDPTIAAAASLYTETIGALRAAGVFIVAAAGNRQAGVGRPANCAGVFAVGSVNRLGYKALYSNFGPEVQLSAPGGDMANPQRQLRCDAITGVADGGVVSTFNKGTQQPDISDTGFGYAAVSGTSFAAPQVAGTAALMWAANPSLTLAQVENGLKASARPHVLAPDLGWCTDANNAYRCTCTTTTCGAGLLDAAEAMRFATSPTGYTAPTAPAVTVTSAALASCGAAQGSTPIPAPPPPAPAPSPSPSPSPAPSPAPAPSDAGGGGGGGGATSGLWLLGLAAGAAALRPRRSAVR